MRRFRIKSVVFEREAEIDDEIECRTDGESEGMDDFERAPWDALRRSCEGKVIEADSIDDAYDDAYQDIEDLTGEEVNHVVLRPARGPGKPLVA